MILYKALCILRIIFVLSPQPGYIHPDEHFQGPEIVYGDVAEYDVYRSWEFTSSAPIRSIVFPYFISVIPALIVRTLKLFQRKPDAYMLLVLPRLFMCVISFFQDFCIYKICILTNLNHQSCLLLFGSSYVTIVYLTRTFSNSLESLYFTILLLILVKILILKDLISKHSCDLLFRRYVFYNFIYSITIILGFFNRPTFICFSLFPTAIWMYTVLKMNIQSKLYGFLAFLLGCLSMTICLTAIDSFYYKKVTFSSVLHAGIDLTPLNFIKYNLNSENLDSHGFHPRWVHLFVNIPLLFSSFGVFLPIYSLKNCFSHFKKFKSCPEMIFLASFLVPLFLLSMIPHQEPRFLIPLIVPLSFLLAYHKFRKDSIFTCVWVLTNLSCFYFYGFIHQAGVYSSIQYLGNENTNNSIIAFYKTYMPPRYLLSIGREQHTKVFDFAGCSEYKFKSSVQNLAAEHNPSNMYIILPMKSFGHHDVNLHKLNYKFIKHVQLIPHFSTENLPEPEVIFNIVEKNSTFDKKLDQFFDLFSIQILVFKKF